jgi:hypothetical protein
MRKEKENEVSRQAANHGQYIKPFINNQDLLDNIYHDNEISVELSDETEVARLTTDDER